MNSDLASTLNILSFGVLSTLCLWVVWTHRVRTSLLNIALLFVLWLSLLCGLEFSIKNPRGLPSFITVMVTILSIYGMYSVFTLEILPFILKVFNVRSSNPASKAHTHHII